METVETKDKRQETRDLLRSFNVWSARVEFRGGQLLGPVGWLLLEELLVLVLGLIFQFHLILCHGVVLKYPSIYHRKHHHTLSTSFFRMLFLGLMCRRARALKQKCSDPAPEKGPAEPLPGCKVDVDVDEDHDAGGDVE